MRSRGAGKVTAWSHEALERRGYKKCQFCWRHLVKIDDHVAAHELGLIGPDGKRRDRTPEERRRWAERYNGNAATERFRSARSMFLPRADYERVLRLPTVDYRIMRTQIDEAVDQDS